MVGGVMDMQKEREAFSRWVLTHPDNRKITAYEENIMFDAWRAAKAQAVPDTYIPIVLALEDVRSKINQASFLTMDAENEYEAYAVDANELAAYIDELIKAQEQK